MDPITTFAVLASIPKEVVEKSERLLHTLAGKALEETGELFADRVRFWRFKNQVSVLRKAEKALKDAGLEPRAVDLKLLVPLIEHASLEEQEDAQSLWAHLLANATQDQRNVIFYRTCVDLLKNISGIEAELLRAMFLEWKAEERRALEFAREKQLAPPHIPDNAVKFSIGQLLSSIPVTDGQVLLDNLLRMNLVRFPEPNMITVYGGSIGMKPSEVYLTYLGIKLLTVCTTLDVANPTATTSTS